MDLTRFLATLLALAIALALTRGGADEGIGAAALRAGVLGVRRGREVAVGA